MTSRSPPPEDADAAAPSAAGAPGPSGLVEIHLGERRFSACRRLLEEQSGYFGALYRSGMREASRPRWSSSGREVQRLRGDLSASGLELVLEFVHASRLPWPGAESALLEELLEAAAYLQVTPLLRLLPSRVRPENCLRLHGLALEHGLRELRDACLDCAADHFHRLLRRPDARRPHPLLPDALQEQLRRRRLEGRAALLALGSLAAGPGRPRQEPPPCALLRYDEVARRWLPLPGEPPPALANVRGYGTAVLDNYLFVVGGLRLGSQEIAAAHCYDPRRHEWSPVAPMNHKRSNFKLLAVSGKLYAVGGQFLSSVEFYSPEHDWWDFAAPLPSPLAEFSACECKDKIYVMGGYTTRDRNLSILQYCPTADAWTDFELCDIHLRKQQMLSVEETIYIVGGYIHELGPNKKCDQNEGTLTVQSYNTTTREWLFLKENTSKSGLNLTCTLHNDGIYILTRDETLSTSLEHRVFLKYNIFSDSWESVRRFPTFGQNMSICSVYLPNLP